MKSHLTRFISDFYRKNIDEIVVLMLFSLPRFVYHNSNALPCNNIPVFSIHSVKPEILEEQFKYLVNNNYKTINSNSLFDIITGRKKASKNTIALTFDDGRKSLWTIAFPLLKKYNLTAISFIVPSVVKSNLPKSSNLNDVWLSRAKLEDIEKIESEIPFINWDEIFEMHESGLVDFQSHSMYHASVYTSEKLIDFVNPGLKPSFLENTLNPLRSNNEKESNSANIKLGSPIYRWKSSLAANTRYIPNENINAACIRYVDTNGGFSFFDNANWRVELRTHFFEVKKKFGKGTFQSNEQRMAEIKKDLIDSRKAIEDYLNKRVTHLCLPWYYGNQLTVQMSKETGYQCLYWGIKNMKSTNYIGDDPYYIKRINDYYIFSLPGKNRISFAQQVINKMKNRRSKYVHRISN